MKFTYHPPIEPSGTDRDYAHPAPVRTTYADVALGLLTLVGVFFWVLLLLGI